MSGGLRISCFDACALQEDDTRRFWTKPLGRYFNPRPPCGGRPERLPHGNCPADFNPRPPCGGRPLFCKSSSVIFVFQSTSSVWRTTANLRPITAMEPEISIHVLRVEDDSPCKRGCSPHAQFQSTSSVWRTTCYRGKSRHTRWISIHVLRVEDDRFTPPTSGSGYISIHVLRVEDDAA